MLREVSPEEVTANIYTLVDVLLHKVHVDLQRGHNIKVPILIDRPHFFFIHSIVLILHLVIYIFFSGDSR